MPSKTNDTLVSNQDRTIINLPLDAGRLRILTLDRQESFVANDLSLDQDMFKLRLANSGGHRESSDLLIKKMYIWRGYDTNTAHGKIPSQITFMADLKGQIIGTLTIGVDSDAGLQADALYKAEIDTLRQAQRFVCEFTRLAVAQDSHSKRVLAALFHLAFIYAHQIRGATDLVIEVNPRHAVFYERMLGFKVLGAERMCSRVNAPAILLRLTCEYVIENIAKYGGSVGEVPHARSLYPFAFSHNEETGIAQRLLRNE